MHQQAALETERLHLRPLQLADADRVQELAGEEAVYRTTLNVPHPYEDGLAERWIADLAPRYYDGRGATWGIDLPGTGLIGCIGLGITKPHARAELGYWIGVPWWGRSYCTEAARAMIGHGFSVMQLHKITATHMAGNPASGRVMQKVGMQQEGRLVDEVRKDGVFHTLVVYGILAKGSSRPT